MPLNGPAILLLRERLQAGLGARKDQCMNVMRTLVGVDRLQIGRMAHDVVFGGDAIGAVHIT